MPLDRYEDPPHISARFNAAKHRETCKRLEEEELLEREASVQERKERLQESDRQRREENRRKDIEGKKAHASNMKLFKESRNRDVEMELQLRKHQTMRKTAAKEAASTTMVSGIDAFEANLKRLGIGEAAAVPEGTSISGDSTYIDRIRQRKQEEVAARKERTKRRQKMLLDHQAVYSSIQQKQQQQQLLEKIAKQSQEERALATELQTQAQWRQVMAANRKFREAQYAVRKSMDEKDALKSTELKRKRELELYEMTRNEELSKVRELLEKKEAKKRAKHYSLCRSTCLQLVELSLKVAEHRERASDLKTTILSGKPLVPGERWRDWVLQFLTGNDDAQPAEELPEEEEVNLEKPESAECTAVQNAEEKQKPDPRRIEILRQLNAEEVKHYISQTQEWSVVSQRAGATEFNAFLCSMLDTVNSVLFPKHVPFVRKQQEPFILVVLMGKNLSGKHVVGKSIAEKLDLVFVDCKMAIKDALASTEDAEALCSGKSDTLQDIILERLELVKTAKEELHKGKEIMDETLCSFIVNHFKWLNATANKSDTTAPFSPRGAVLCGFPRNAHQFDLLECKLTSYDPELIERIPESELAPRWAADMSPVEFMTWVGDCIQQEWGGDEQGESADDSEKKCDSTEALSSEEAALLQYGDEDETAIDLVLNFELSDTEVFARYAGERVDPLSGKLYHMVYNPPPDDVLDRLKVVERSAAEADLLHDKLAAYRHDRKRVMKWLQRTDNCTSLNAEQDIGDVISDALKAVEEAIEKREVHERKKHLRDELRKSRGEERDEVVPVEDTGEAAPQHVRAIRTPLKLTSEAADVVHKQWGEIVSMFTDGISKVLLELRKLKNDSMEHFVSISAHFQQVLSKPTEWQVRIDEFQEAFNAFSIELRRECEGKAELHLRTDTLQAILWAISDTQRDETEAVLASYRASPWNAAFTSAVYLQFSNMVEIEVTRFVFTKRLVLFTMGILFCVDRDLILQPQDSQASSADVVPDFMALLDETQQQQQNPPGTAGGKKRDAGKGGKKPPQQQQQQQQQQEGAEPADEFQRVLKKALAWVAEVEGAAVDSPTTVLPQEREEPVLILPPLKERLVLTEQKAAKIWRKEAELLRSRLELLSTKCDSFLEEVFEQSSMLYDKLEEKMKDLHKRQMAATKALVSHVRRCIEEEQPMPQKLFMSVTDASFCIDEGKFVAAPIPVPTVLPTKDYGDSADAVVPHLRKTDFAALISRCRSSGPHGVISTRDLVHILMAFASSAPTPWEHCTAASLASSVEPFDYLKLGCLDWRSFLSSLLLWSGEPIGNPLWVGPPTLLDLVTLREELEKTTGTSNLTKKAFLGVNFWFDSAVSAVRARQVKEVLWDIFHTPAHQEDRPKPVIRSGSAGGKKKDKDRPSSGKQATASDPSNPSTPHPPSPPPEGPVLHIRNFLLYLCPDKQVLRGCQKAFAVVSREDGFVSKEDVRDVFHFSKYPACDAITDDTYSTNSINAMFDSIVVRMADGDVDAEAAETGTREELEPKQPSVPAITFAQLCAWHLGRVMLNNAVMLLQRPVSFIQAPN